MKSGRASLGSELSLKNKRIDLVEVWQRGSDSWKLGALLPVLRTAPLAGRCRHRSR